MRKNLIFILLLSASSFALRDPTRPIKVDSGEDNGSAVIINMIKLKPGDAGNATATINGNIVKTGDEVNGMKVVEIRRDAVVLRAADKSLVLVSMYPYKIKMQNTDKKIGEHNAIKNDK